MSDEQYFTNQPRTGSTAGTVKQKTAQLRVDDKILQVVLDSGVFARKGIDAGTMVLIDAAARPPAMGNFLDLGCGSGAIALTLAARSPKATVYAIDVNERAIALTASNAKVNNLSNITVLLPTSVNPDLRFDLIWSNPPIRIGKNELHALLQLWLSKLTETGEAWLVVNRNLGSDSLAIWLTSIGYQVDRLVSKQGYRVLRVRPTRVADQSEF
ncbi:MAG: methyltransferase [Actinobacteria bacterium]|nr:methyltransferase [Actinomycetota bacterium]